MLCPATLGPAISPSGNGFAFPGHDDADLVVGHIDRVGQRYCEQEWVDAIDARRYHRHLRPALAAVIDESLSILKGIALDLARDDAASRQGFAVARLDDSDLSRRHRDRLHYAHLEQERIDAVRPRGNDGHLRTSLAAIGKKRTRILKGVAIDMLRDDTAAREGLAVARFDASDSTLGNRQELLPVDRKLPRPQAHVKAWRQRVRLKSGLAVQRDNPAVREPAILAYQDEFFGDDPNRVVGDDDHAQHPKYEPVCGQQHRGHDEDNDQISMIEDNVHDAPFAEGACRSTIPRTLTTEWRAPSWLGIPCSLFFLSRSYRRQHAESIV
jgi:hypothetical protein